jgi:dTDP-4-dehydrorhamnose reductase
MGRAPVAVLGGSGMLGAMTVEVLSADPSLEVVGTVRDPAAAARLAALYPTVKWRSLDAEQVDESAIARAIDGVAWVINCIGVIKPYIHDDRADEVERALRVNGLFPHLLARTAAKVGAQVLQIATDCVYSGRAGNYSERAEHDALDVYGKTKSLGEAHATAVHHLRCSIIGPEAQGRLSLLEWFLAQPRGGEVNGFTNHLWNGVTTLHFAQLCRGIIAKGLALPHLVHVVPSATVSKAEMLSCFGRVFGREDLRVRPMATPIAIDRTLATEQSDLNGRLWTAAGYTVPPTVPQMIEELGRGSYRFREART